MKMYSASLQSYNYGYNRSKGIIISAIANFLLLFLLLSTSGVIFGNAIRSQNNNTQTISIKGYNVITHSEEVKEKNTQPSVDEIQDEVVIPNDTKKIKPKKQHEKIIKSVAKKISAPSKKSVEQKQVNNTDQNPSNEKQNNANIAVEPTHFGIQNPPPEYPMISFQRNESGSVTIEYTVSSDGNVSDAKVIQSSGYPRLDKMSLITFKRWKFKPAISITGIPVESMPRKITFVFDIHTQTIKEE